MVLAGGPQSWAVKGADSLLTAHWRSGFTGEATDPTLETRPHSQASSSAPGIQGESSGEEIEEGAMAERLKPQAVSCGTHHPGAAPVPSSQPTCTFLKRAEATSFSSAWKVHSPGPGGVRINGNPFCEAPAAGSWGRQSFPWPAGDLEPR